MNILNHNQNPKQRAIKMFNMAIKSNPVYIRAYLCRAQAYRIIHDVCF